MSPVGLGTDHSLDPIGDLAAKYGLTQTSGARPGSITSSGNVSLHASGDAADWSGPPAKMLAFFNAVRRTYGSVLDELIYTPGGAQQLKNGQPFTYTGAVAQDHYDHVHTGYTGKLGTLGTATTGAAFAGAGGSSTEQSKGGGVLGGVVDSLRESGARLLLQTALILGGAILALWGLTIAAGSSPARVATNVIPAGRAARAAGAIK